ncbi:hypothetical protein UA08_05027 [Talaromyces atroroseus]|uniref:Xylanolytic transcriptional activator regulatory domain-containing protein n=1 Tax=Talaromyces atroroseus TaxID=1441469 RepID=A0A225AVU5_TALAT|nr:hypothetical protein UA08_05027 [Talaromyces atroroseus]OKL59729.1 hypothetical protein UA08_05027 [Talaromyces atroroseus]
MTPAAPSRNESRDRGCPVLLKCNRLHPCDNCIKHQRTYMCHYEAPPFLSSRQSQGIQNHLRELEFRIEHLSGVNLQSHTPSNAEHGAQDKAAATSLSDHHAGPSVGNNQPKLDKNNPGTIVLQRGGTRYVTPTHWQAVMDEIAEVKDYLELDNVEVEPEEDYPDISGPVLLFGNTLSSQKAELLAALPVRSVADRLVSFYLNSKESTLVLMHVPTFTKEYSHFWKAPEETSINQLAFLFSIFCAGTGLQLFSTSGRADGVLAESFDVYHRLASQCLIMSNYSSPGRYKMEALVLSVAMEILRSTDTHAGPSLLLGLASRLAVHGGYHRDPKHHHKISPFEGEMRRRVWMYLSLLDHYISLQAGLPPATAQSQSDTEEPRNLNDEDLNPFMTKLPPARPPTESTLVLFPATLNRIMLAGAEIIAKVCSVKGVPYREVLRLDAKLKEIHTTTPPPLQYRPLSESIADSPNMIMDRYNIELMYQKARCDLHRRYLAQHRIDPAYAYSRQECLDAARRVLQHQADIFDANSAGGQLSYTSFFFSPIVVVHFRSAAMIALLEISCQSRYDLKQKLSPNERNSILAARQQLSQDIERSYNIWKHLCHQSKEAVKTAKALHIMMKVTNNHLQHGATPEQEQPSSLRLVNSTLLMATPPNSNQPPVNLANQYSPLDVDIMDATLYLGQDALAHPSGTQFTGSTDVVDFYDRYWDNLMLLGDDQTFDDMTFDSGNQGHTEAGLP